MGEIIYNNETSEQKQYNIPSIWRLFAYFIIYSVIGCFIETIFAFLVDGVLESRQSFLYGPICSIYGGGAILMIVLLTPFSKNNYILFLAGVIVGTISEYVVHWVGEMWFNTLWWDYSDQFLNINGRICLMYSIMWGIIAICLIKYINPQVDVFIDKLSSKMKGNTGKIILTLIMGLILVDKFYSSAAQSWVRTKVCIENDLNVKDKVALETKYNQMYSDAKTKDFVDKYWTVEKILYATPNIKIQLENNEKILVRDLYPEIKPYYYKINKEEKKWILF